MSANPRPGSLGRVLQLSTGAVRATGGFFRKRVWLWPLLAAVVLGGLAVWIDHAIAAAMKDRLHGELTTILNADVKALKTWLQLRQAEAQSLAGNPDVRAAVQGLLDTPPRPEALKALRRQLQSPLDEMHYEDFFVVDPFGRIVAANEDDVIGKALTGYGREFFDGVLDSGRPGVSRPFRSALPLADDGGQVQTALPSMFAAAPVVPDRRPVAVLGLRVLPEKDFSDILRVARSGQSGETYAFDAGGLLLSQSRFDDDLKRMGLLLDKPDSHSILTLELRDPQVNMARGERPALKRSEQPLTTMAAAAVRKVNGSNLDGYRDYRGVPVVGAWTWLDEYDFGVATEVDADEAFAALAILRYMFWGLIALLGVCAAGLFVLGLVVARQRRMMQVAKQLGQYTLLEKLGEGGMGTVYKAQHALLRRPTAVKLLDSAKVSEAIVARFEREVQLTSQLNHHNTIAIFDFGRTPQGIFYYAMEYLDGVNLEDLVLRHGALPGGRVIHVLRQVCDALAEAHGLGLIHRDIKPANVILNHRAGVPDFVKVLDFGLVKPIGGAAAQLTSHDMMVGTPQYMAPEAIDQPEKIDARADIYALGAVGYFLLTASPVFGGKTTLELCRQHLREEPEPPSRRLGRSVPADLEAIILSCLSKRPSDRPASAAELSEQLGLCREAGAWTRADAEAWWQRH